MTEKIILIYLIAVNGIAFILYGIDKGKAKAQAWRIPEMTLLLWAFIGGSFGAYAAMQIFRHKTKHKKFIFFVPLCMALHIALILWLWL